MFTYIFLINSYFNKPLIKSNNLVTCTKTQNEYYCSTCILLTFISKLYFPMVLVPYNSVRDQPFFLFERRGKKLFGIFPCFGKVFSYNVVSAVISIKHFVCLFMLLS